jgi:hypothetical protein
MMEENSQSLLTHRLKNNYLLLHRQYRLGQFEGHIGYVRKWRPSQTSAIEFYELCDEKENAKAGNLSFAEAIQDLYRMITYLKQQPDTFNGSAILILKCKCLIYEATDYSLNVPVELGNYFIEFVIRFPGDRPSVEKLAEDLNGRAYRSKDERARAIKLLLVAGLCGVNQLYRAHNANSYHQAFKTLEKLNRFIRDELPPEHEEPRQSYGLTGLSQYLTGQVYSRKGMIKESRDQLRLARPCSLMSSPRLRYFNLPNTYRQSSRFHFELRFSTEL